MKAIEKNKSNREKQQSLRIERNIIMKETLEFLKGCQTFYLATVEGDQPHVRPFGAVCEFEDKLYIVTNNQKDVYRQMMKNGKVEICGMYQDKWIRVKGTAKLDERREARVAMMEDNNADLSSMYTVDDNLMVVFSLENATATIYSFTEEPKTYTF